MTVCELKSNYVITFSVFILHFAKSSAFFALSYFSLMQPFCIISYGVLLVILRTLPFVGILSHIPRESKRS